MSVAAVRQKYEKEMQDIQARMDRLATRADFLKRVIAELRSAGGKEVPKAKRGRKPGRKSGMTVANSILKAVADAAEPIAPKRIIAAAAALSRGAAASIRSQINLLTKQGRLEQVPYAGRGFLYRIAGAAKAKEEPAKAPARKRVTKKKGPGKKKAPAKKPAAKKKTPGSRRAPKVKAPAMPTPETAPDA